MERCRISERRHCPNAPCDSTPGRLLPRNGCYVTLKSVRESRGKVVHLRVLRAARDVATLELHSEVNDMTANSVVRARIDTETKERATAALEAMGLSVSDAIRLLMLRIADEERLPFEVKVPTPATAKAMKELEAGKGQQFETPDALFSDLGI